jgi:hypothetical protein
VSDEGLSGFDVHVASRICSAAHGGQILVSATTHDLVEDHLPARTGLRDLGEHLLKDIDRPARLFQLVIEELDESRQPHRAFNGEAEVGSLRQQEPTAASRQVPAESVRSASPSLRARAALRAALRRRFGRVSSEQVGARIHSMAKLAPSPELGGALRALGGGILQAARDDRGVENLLKSIDRRALKRRLSELRSASFLTERDAKLADGLARQVAAIEHLASLRGALRAEMARIEVRTDEIRQQVFAARLGDPLAGNLVDEISAFCETIGSLRERLRETKDEASHPIPPGGPSAG